MSAARFVICPGKVRSRNDGDYHYIGVGALVRLYQLRPGEYVVAGRHLGHQGLQPLYPRADGNYGRPAFEIRGEDPPSEGSVVRVVDQ